MTDTITVGIPADVRDNNTHTVRVTSNGTRHREGTRSAAEHVEWYRRKADTFGYSVYEFDTTDRDDNRVTLTWFASADGEAVWLYETSYYTRVDCAHCVYHWAQAYVTVEQDGQMTDPEPLCGDHIVMEEIRISNARRAGVEARLYRSEWLRIGQHE